MVLLTATHKASGKRYYYAVKYTWGKKFYTADIVGVAEETWHKSLSEARIAAVSNGRIMIVS